MTPALFNNVDTSELFGHIDGRFNIVLFGDATLYVLGCTIGFVLDASMRWLAGFTRSPADVSDDHVRPVFGETDPDSSTESAGTNSNDGGPPAQQLTNSAR